jgi:hypothetical protein
MLRNIFSFALVVMLVVLFASNIQAQTLANANLPTSASVITALSITKTANLAFGNVGQGVTAVIDPKGSGHSYVGSTATVGAFTVLGEPSTPVIISWPATLDMTTGGHTITVTFRVNGDTDPAKQATSAKTNFTSGTACTTDATTGNYYLWVGGSLPTGGNSGSYSSSANFTVEYQ